MLLPGGRAIARARHHGVRMRRQRRERRQPFGIARRQRAPPDRRRDESGSDIAGARSASPAARAMRAPRLRRAAHSLRSPRAQAAAAPRARSRPARARVRTRARPARSRRACRPARRRRNGDRHRPATPAWAKVRSSSSCHTRGARTSSASSPMMRAVDQVQRGESAPLRRGNSTARFDVGAEFVAVRHALRAVRAQVCRNAGKPVSQRVTAIRAANPQELPQRFMRHWPDCRPSPLRSPTNARAVAAAARQPSAPDVRPGCRCAARNTAMR